MTHAPPGLRIRTVFFFFLQSGGHPYSTASLRVAEQPNRRPPSDPKKCSYLSSKDRSPQSVRSKRIGLHQLPFGEEGSRKTDRFRAEGSPDQLAFRRRLRLSGSCRNSDYTSFCSFQERGFIVRPFTTPAMMISRWEFLDDCAAFRVHINARRKSVTVTDR